MKNLRNISIVIIVLLISTLGCLLNHNSNQNKTNIKWDDGIWSNYIELKSESNYNYQSFSIVEYQDTLYIFYNIISKSTYSGSDYITLNQSYFYDIVYRTYDGVNLSEELYLTDVHDNVSSNYLSLLCYQNKLILFTENRLITNYTPFTRNREFLSYQFDGKNWDSFPNPFENNRTDLTGGHYIDSLVNGGKIYTFWKRKSYYEINEFGYTYFDGDSWSDAINFSFPTGTNSVKFKSIDNQIWTVWGDWTVGHNTQDIYAGIFENGTFTQIYQMTMEDDHVINFRPDIEKIGDFIIVAWESDYFSIHSEGMHSVMRLIKNGTLDKIYCVSKDNSNGNYETNLLYYNEELYISWRNVNHDSHLLIRSWDKISFSKIYEITDKSHSGAYYPQFIVFKEKLYCFWMTVDVGDRIYLRSYQRN